MSGVCPKCGFAVNEREVAICARTDCPGDETLKSFGYDASCRAMTDWTGHIEDRRSMTPLEIVADAMRSAGEVGFMPWDQLPEAAREQYLEAARAAIAAIPVDEATCDAFASGALREPGPDTDEIISVADGIEALKRHILEQK